MNERGVALAESTCASVFAGDRSKARLDIVDLSAMGLERADNARSAVEIMGRAAETRGYHDAGESLLVADAAEAWIFHVSPDDTGTGAVWAATRVPDDHVGVVANAFSIREIDFDDSSRFLASRNLREVAVRTKRWPGEGKGVPFDFARIFSGPEAGHKYSSGHRVWAAYRRLADPEEFARLPLYYDEYVSDAPYPATLPARNVTLTAMKDTMRDYYEGTDLDLAKGNDDNAAVSGPFGSPERWTASVEDLEAFPKLGWERPIASSRTILSYVATLRNDDDDDDVGAVLWVSFHAAHAAVAMPLPVGLLRTNATTTRYKRLLPEGFSGNSLSEMRRGVSAVQATRMVLNAARLRFDRAIRDVRAAQREWEEEGRGGEVLAGISNGTLPLVDTIVAHGEAALRRWWDLSDELFLRYADGLYHDVNGGGARPRALGYPAEWLRAVGYSPTRTPASPVPPPPMTADETTAAT